MSIGKIAMWAAFTSLCPDGVSYEEWTNMRYNKSYQRFAKRSQKKIRLNRRRVNGGQRK